MCVCVCLSAEKLKNADQHSPGGVGKGSTQSICSSRTHSLIIIVIVIILSISSLTNIIVVVVVIIIVSLNFCLSVFFL